MQKKLCYAIIVCLSIGGCSKPISCSSNEVTDTLKKLVLQQIQQNQFYNVFEPAKSSIGINGVRSSSSSSSAVSCQAEADFNKVITAEWLKGKNIISAPENDHFLFDISYDVTRTDDGKQDYIKLYSMTPTGRR